MIFFDYYPIFLSIILIFSLGWLLPVNGKTLDVLKLRLDLFPNWVKFVSVGWILVTLLLVIFVFHSTKRWEYFLTVNLNFSFFLMFFSKEKNEDEFSEQLRMKAFVYAIISFISIVILFGAVNIKQEMSEILFLNSNITVQIFMGISLLSAIINFYVSKYKFSK